MPVLTTLLLLGGVVALLAGGEVLVRGATGAALALGLSPLIIGLTIVAFATSAPELAITLQAVADGSPGIAIGNVVGSNIANILLILGVAALVRALATDGGMRRFDIPVMVGLSALSWLLAADGRVGPTDGVLLVAALVGYLLVAVVRGRRDGPAGMSPPGPRPGTGVRSGSGGPGRSGGTATSLLLVGGGVVLLVVGARALVTGATQIAAALGVSELLIGLTVVAVGTSLPELATSVVAVARGHGDLAVGNVVGSNIMNLGAILGAAALVAPGGIPVERQAVVAEFPAMTAAAVLLLAVALLARGVGRITGAVLLVAYAGYLTHLTLAQVGVAT